MSTKPEIDGDDLRALLNFEESVKASLAAIDAFEPVLERLTAIKYPGMEDVDAFLGFGDLPGLAEVLEDVQLADGDQAAWDYRKYMVRDELDLADAITALLDEAGEENAPRIASLIHYAQSVA